MSVIEVPRPPKKAMNPNRPANALLMTQVKHMHEAEKRLPLGYRTDIYINAIKTEGEVAQYIREVTAAIHRAHEDAARKRAKPAPKRKSTLQIAAVADEKLYTVKPNVQKKRQRVRRMPKERH